VLQADELAAERGALTGKRNRQKILMMPTLVYTSEPCTRAGSSGELHGRDAMGSACRLRLEFFPPERLVRA